MAWNGLILTVGGRNALTQSQIDGEIKIKSIVVGDGNPPSNFNTQKKLVNQLFEITNIDIKRTESGCIVTGDFPKVDYDYYFREIGIIVLAGREEVLYVYDNCGDRAACIVNSTGAESIEKRIRLSLIFSGVAKVNAVTPSLLYVAESGGDISSTVLNQIEEIRETNPIIQAGESLKVIIGKIIKLMSAKVDKVSGKGLSANDYTTAEKNKLGGISAGAQKNVQADWAENASGSDAYIKNKPTKLSQLKNDEDIEFMPVNGIPRGIRGSVAQSDYWCVRGGGADDNGYLEIATGDNGNEPIYVRQYEAGTPWNGGTVARQLALLDFDGASRFPGYVEVQNLGSRGNITADNWVGVNEGLYIRPTTPNGGAIHFRSPGEDYVYAHIHHHIKGYLNLTAHHEVQIHSPKAYIHGELGNQGAAGNAFNIRLYPPTDTRPAFGLRYDDHNLYFMFTNANDRFGSFNGLRPIRIQNSDGWVHMENGLSVHHHALFAEKGLLSRNGALVSEGETYLNNGAQINNGHFTCNTGATFSGNINMANNRAALHGMAIELFSDVPAIDFHHQHSHADFTSRLAEWESGVLTCQNSFNVQDGTYRKHGVPGMITAVQPDAPWSGGVMWAW